MLRALLFYILTSICGAPLLDAQLLDTRVNARLTPSDSINRRLAESESFLLSVNDPKVVNRKGMEMVNGFEVYYLYVVTARDILIEGQPMLHGGANVYFLMTSEYKQIDFELEPFETRTTLLKGMIDKPDSMMRVYREKINESAALVDTLEKQLTGMKQIPNKLRRKYDAAGTMLNNDRYYYQLYLLFKDYKKRPLNDFPEYFTSSAYNFRNLHNGVTHQLGQLPQIELTEDQKLLLAERDKGGLFNTGLFSKKDKPKRKNSYTNENTPYGDDEPEDFNLDNSRAPEDPAEFEDIEEDLPEPSEDDFDNDW